MFLFGADDRAISNENEPGRWCAIGLIVCLCCRNASADVLSIAQSLPPSAAEELELIAGDQRPRITTLREDNHRIRYLTLDEEEQLRKAAAPFWPYFCDTIVVDISTGLRREELFGLTKEDVDFNSNMINVLKTKSGKARRIPIDPNGEAYAIQYFNDGGSGGE